MPALWKSKYEKGREVSELHFWENGGSEIEQYSLLPLDNEKPGNKIQTLGGYKKENTGKLRQKFQASKYSINSLWSKEKETEQGRKVKYFGRHIQKEMQKQYLKIGWNNTRPLATIPIT